MVDTRSLVLIDDGIDINVLNADRHRLEQRHVATSHHFDENPRVLILAPLPALGVTTCIASLDPPTTTKTSAMHDVT